MIPKTSFSELLSNPTIRAVRAVCQGLQELDSYHAWMLIGVLEEVVDQHHRAVYAYEQALKKNPIPLAKISLARAHGKIGHSKRAFNLVKSIPSKEYEFLLKSYDKSIYRGFLPDCLQLEVDRHFLEKDLLPVSEYDTVHGLISLNEENSAVKMLETMPNGVNSNYYALAHLLLGKRSDSSLDRLVRNDFCKKLVLELKECQKTEGESIFLSKAKAILNDKEYYRLDLIDGWLSPLEGRTLAIIAEQAPKGSSIVEIGSWKGKSTCFLGLGSSKGNKIPVWAVDPHEWTDDVQVPNTLAAWHSAIERARLSGIVTNIRKKSKDASEFFKQRIFLLFIDGEHNELSVRTDIERWIPFLIPGAFIAIHDAYFTEVYRVLKDIIWSDKRFIVIDLIGSLILIQFFPQVSTNRKRSFREVTSWLYLDHKTHWLELHFQRAKDELRKLAKDFMKKSRGFGEEEIQDKARIMPSRKEAKGVI